VRERPRHDVGDLVIVEALSGGAQLGQITGIAADRGTSWSYQVRIPGRVPMLVTAREIRRANSHDLDRHDVSWIVEAVAASLDDARERVLSARWRVAVADLRRAASPGDAQDNERTRRLDLDYHAVLAVAGRLGWLEAEVARLRAELRKPAF
jgi:uncharacterized small protein (DUF1192 family)